MSDRPSSSRPPAPATENTGVDRRSFLKYVGAGASALFGAAQLGSLTGCAGSDQKAVHSGAWVLDGGRPGWQPPAYPVPLPGDSGDDAQRLATYQVRDELVLPEGFRYDVLVSWGDELGAAGHRIVFGNNNDYTGLVAIPGTDDQYWLMVNHEYFSARPWLQGYAEVFGKSLPRFEVLAAPNTPFERYGRLKIGEWISEEGHEVHLEPAASRQEVPDAVRDQIRQVSEAGLAEMGISILRVRRLADGRFEVVRDAADHRRITAVEAINIDLPQPFSFTGPAAGLLAPSPRGTICNCSGGTTPWGTFLTCEENIQYQVDAEVTPAGELLPDRSHTFSAEGEVVNRRLITEVPEPTILNGLGYGIAEPLDGREYGWVCEIDPATGGMQKHTALGRVRHENVALRVQKGQRLAAYMGDDRRGGHIWKFVSDAAVDDPADPANSALLSAGTLYVARFEEDYSGRWIPLTRDTPLRAPEPDHCPSGHVLVPARFVGGWVGVGDTERDRPALEVAEWQSIIERFTGKPFAESTLGDLVNPSGADEAETAVLEQGVLMMDAFGMANACGGTPTARPEDLEVHPEDHSVYIAFTDATDGGDGSPDMRIFPDSKRRNSRQYGAIFRIEEEGSDPAATRFTWGRFVASGEVAAKGGGFASADNLVFDPGGHLWMVTDISTTALNVPTTRQGIDDTRPGGKLFPGVFGNNAMFMLPTSGPQTGVPHCFAIGPMDCELCGPTFSEDGEALILSVQHPGEQQGIRTAERPDLEAVYTVHDRADQPFEQRRTVPVGSNFPSGELGRVPRPSVVCITRRT